MKREEFLTSPVRPRLTDPEGGGTSGRRWRDKWQKECLELKEEKDRGGRDIIEGGKEVEEMDGERNTGESREVCCSGEKKVEG